MNTITQDSLPAAAERLERQLESAVNPREKLELLVKLARKTFRSDPTRTWSIIAEGMEIAEKIGDAHAILEGHCIMADLLIFRGRYSEALQALQRAEDVLSDTNASPTEQARIESLHGKMLFATGRFTEAAQVLLPSLHRFKSHADVPGIVQVSSSLAAVYGIFLMYEEAISLYMDALELVDEETHPEYLGVLNNGIGSLYSMLEDKQEAIRFFTQALSWYRRAGDMYGAGIALMNIGVSYEEQERWAESLEAYMEALPIARTGEPGMLATILTNIGTLHEHSNRLDEALACEQEALDIIGRDESEEPHPVRYRIFRCLGRLYGKMGRHAEAERYLLEGLRMAESSGDLDAQYQLHGQLTEHYRMIGDAERALTHSTRGEELWAEGNGSTALGNIVRLTARRELQRLSDEQEFLAARVTDLEEENRRQAYNLTATALQMTRKQEVLLRLKELTAGTRSDDQDELVSLLRTILSTEVNATNDEGWKQFEAGFLSLHPEFIANITLRCPGLTPAELKIALLLKIGLTTKEIADILYISIHTANTHRRRLRHKLGLRENANLVSFLTSI